VASTVAKVLTVLVPICVALNVYQTIGRFKLLDTAQPALSFALAGAAAFVVSGLLGSGAALGDSSQLLHFTWFAPGRAWLQYYGFFALVVFGAAYYLLPQVMGSPAPFGAWVRLHFWLAAGGVVLVSVPLLAGGVVQALKLQNAAVLPQDVLKATLPFLRIATLGDLAMLLGHLLFVGNLVVWAVRFYRNRAAATYSELTADLFATAEARS
jgi:cytochrome c oxidase cbb3-type subunit 1